MTFTDGSSNALWQGQVRGFLLFYYLWFIYLVFVLKVSAYIHIVYLIYKPT